MPTVRLNVILLAILTFQGGEAAMAPPPPPPAPRGSTAMTHFSHCSAFTQDNNFGLDDLKCENAKGNNIDMCQYTTKHNCGSSEGIWVSCKTTGCDPPSFLAPNRPAPPPPPVPVITAISLQPADGQTGSTYVGQPRIEGLLFATMGDQSGGYVCDDYFDLDDNAATVACRQLSPIYTSGTHCNSKLNMQQCRPVGNVETGMCQGYALDDLQCAGTEPTLSGCTGGVGRESANCWAQEAVYLVCASGGQPATCPPPPPAQIQLWDPRTQQPSRSAGVLRARIGNGPWGPVCDDAFDRNNNAVEVVCREILGGYVAPNTFCHDNYFTTDVNFVLDDVTCPDDTFHTALTLSQGCTYETSHNCGSTEGIWIQCGNPTCAPPPRPPPPPPAVITALKLVGPGEQDTTRTGVGTLQAQVRDPQTGQSRWGYVCDDRFDYGSNGANVACHQLGYAGGGVHCDAEIVCGAAGCDYAVDDVEPGRDPGRPQHV
eukprot:SAG22_NODE_620_length_8513_cov_3.934870_5_plen_486_part_00